jgi:hypothetical protein
MLWFKNREVNYFEFCKLWSSSAFRLVLEKKIHCCGKDPKHRYDVDGYVHKAKHHGDGINWRKEPIDPMALYASGGGRSHGH